MKSELLKIVEEENNNDSKNIFDMYKNQSEDFLAMLKFIKAEAEVIDELIRDVTGDFPLMDCHQYLKNAVKDKTRYGVLIPVIKLLRLTNESYHELLDLPQPHRSKI